VRAFCSARHPGFAELAAVGHWCATLAPGPREFFLPSRLRAAGKTAFCPSHRRRAARRRYRRADHRRRADRASQDAVGPGRRIHGLSRWIRSSPTRRRRRRRKYHGVRRHLRAGGQAIPPDTGCAPRITEPWSFFDGESTTAATRRAGARPSVRPFEDAARRLALTGHAPFAATTARIPFVNYEPDGERGVAARRPTTPTATRRPLPTVWSARVVFLAYSGEARWAGQCGRGTRGTPRRATQCRAGPPAAVGARR